MVRYKIDLTAFRHIQSNSHFHYDHHKFLICEIENFGPLFYNVICLPFFNSTRHTQQKSPYN
jgi:hypothetical protein